VHSLTKSRRETGPEPANGTGGSISEPPLTLFSNLDAARERVFSGVCRDLYRRRADNPEACRIGGEGVVEGIAFEVSKRAVRLNQRESGARELGAARSLQGERQSLG
jgi:hypothetical protein